MGTSSPRSRRSAVARSTRDPFSFIPYPFANGQPGGEIGLTTGRRTELGRVVRQIHDAQVEIDPLVMAYYRFDWVVQELAAYWRRVFAKPDVGDDTSAQGLDMLADVRARSRR